MTDLKALEKAARRFLFENSSVSHNQNPMSSELLEIICWNEIDKELGLGGSVQERIEFKGAAELPLLNSSPRLVKLQQAIRH